ncbi:MAG: glycoside hydrolase family 2 TIM barrel-domain containing protein [Carbonactinosporaceae bacterium]
MSGRHGGSARMSRRDLLRAGACGAVGLAGAAQLGHRWAASEAPARLHVPGRVVPLDADWLFGGAWTPGSTDPDFDDRDFAAVTLPHCPVGLSWRDWDPAGWERAWVYRRHFDLSHVLTDTRLFVDFTGALTRTTPTINGAQLPRHLGGYLDFSYEITDHVVDRDNVLALAVDASSLNCPPYRPGDPRSADYMQPGGLYREVSLRSVPAVFIDDVFARPVDVLDPRRRRIELELTIDAAAAPSRPVRVQVRLRDGDRTVSRTTAPVHLSEPGRVRVEATLSGLRDVTLWDVDDPKLYEVEATLIIGRRPGHIHRTRTGLRDARFTTDGFFLNGRRLKLFGLNRHQTYPYAGMAMPARVQRRDAELLRHELNCNFVRCSHYTQSKHFLDACDDLGILVWDEPASWRHIGDERWQDLFVRNVRDMVRRDRNHPSVVLWSVQVNHSPRAPELYRRARDAAKALDTSRPTTGANGYLRHHDRDEFLQDVFGQNEYHAASPGNATLRPPFDDIPYVITEAVGAFDYYRLTGRHWSHDWTRRMPARRQYDHARLHAQVHSAAGLDDRYCGVAAWCAFDYQSPHSKDPHALVAPGVVDTFRVPKLGAAIYQSQVDPHTRPVIAPSFYWDFGPNSPKHGPGRQAMICSNCDRLEVFVAGRHHATVHPDRDGFAGLRYPPSFVDLTVGRRGLPELRIDGFVGGRRVLSRRFSSNPSGDNLAVAVDDDELRADGIDATRVPFRAADRYGAPRPYPEGEVRIDVEGPGELVGDSPFAFADAGGTGAVWIRTIRGVPGRIQVTMSHPRLGSPQVTIHSTDPAPGRGTPR